jgi:hypothetical protein
MPNASWVSGKAGMTQEQKAVLDKAHEVTRYQEEEDWQLKFVLSNYGEQNTINQDGVVVGANQHKGKFCLTKAIERKGMLVEILSTVPTLQHVPYDNIALHRHQFRFTLTGKPVAASVADACIAHFAASSTARAPTPTPPPERSELNGVEQNDVQFSASHNYSGRIFFTYSHYSDKFTQVLVNFSLMKASAST